MSLCQGVGCALRQLLRSLHMPRVWVVPPQQLHSCKRARRHTCTGAARSRAEL